MKKTVKILWIINLILYGATLLGFFGYLLGFALMVLLGVVQLVISIILSVMWKRLPSVGRSMMAIYWAAVALFGIGVYLFNQEDIEILLVWGVVPMLIATYHMYMLFKLKSITYMFETPKQALNVLDEEF
jgi:hypothetical protein